MSYALVRTDHGVFKTVDIELLSARTLGAKVSVMTDFMESESFEAVLVDTGTIGQMMDKEFELEGLTGEEQIERLAKKPVRERRAKKDMMAEFMVDDESPAVKRRYTKRGTKGTGNSNDAPLSQTADRPATSNRDDEEEVVMDDGALLRAIYQKVCAIERKLEDNEQWKERVDDDLTGIKAFVEMAAETRESDGTDMSAVLRSMETQEDSLVQMEKKLDDMAERMPAKLDVQYVYLTEEAVGECDKPGESSKEFAQRLAEKVFPEHELLEPVESRNQKMFEWVVDTVFRRRAYSERHSTRKHVRSEIKAHLDQKARRARDAIGLAHPVPARMRKQQEAAQQKEELAKRVEERRKEAEAKRKEIMDRRVANATQHQLRHEGLLDRDGDVNVYNMHIPPPFRSPRVPHSTMPRGRQQLLAARLAASPTRRQPLPSRRRSQSTPAMHRMEMVDQEAWMERRAGDMMDEGDVEEPINLLTCTDAEFEANEFRRPLKRERRY